MVVGDFPLSFKLLLGYRQTVIKLGEMLGKAIEFT